MSVCWRDGNQQCDAELFQSGDYVDQGYFPAHCFLEVTGSVHPNEHLSRELLDAGGVTFGPDGMRRLKSREIESVPVVHTSREFIEAYAGLVLKQIAKKAKKGYPKDTVLIIQCTLNRLYMPDEWADLMTRVNRAVSQSAFREIFLYDPVCHYSQALHPRNVDVV